MAPDREHDASPTPLNPEAWRHFQRLPVPCWVADATSRLVLAANEAARSALGISADGRATTDDAAGPEGAAALRALAARADALRGAGAEARLRESDGSARRRSATARLVTFDGRPAHLWVAAPATEAPPDPFAETATAAWKSIVGERGHAIVATDAQGLVTGFSPAAEGLFGRKADDVVGRVAFADLRVRVERDLGFETARFAADERPATCLGALLASAPRGPLNEVEALVLRADGRDVPVVVFATKLHDAAGGTVGHLGLFVDASEPRLQRRQFAHERAVLEAIARGAALPEILTRLIKGHEALFPGTLGSVLLLDAEGRRFAEAFGPSVPPAFTSGIIGVTIGPSVGSCGTAAYADRTVVVDDIAAHPYWAEFREAALAAGLRACWSAPIHGADRRVVGTFALYYGAPRAPGAAELAAIENAARLAGLALERTRAEERLRAFSDRLGLALHASGMGVWETDFARGVTTCDARAAEILGLPDRGGCVLENASARLLIHPDDRAAVSAAHAAGVASGRTFRLEFRVVLTDGRTRHLEAHAVVRRDAAGVPKGVVGLAADVTAPRELQERLHRAHRLESIGRLAGGIAHDLNNLLTPILIAAPMLRDAIVDPNDLQLVDAVESGARRGAEVVSRLLTFARGAEGRREAADVAAIVDDLLRMTRETFPKNVVVRVEGCGEGAVVVGDPTQLHQVLLNLCVNARDAMPQGGTLAITVSRADVDAETARGFLGASPGPHVVVSVRDTGEGIPPEHMERLFEPFFSTKDPGKGTGLGLATTLGIVKSHGGFVQVESAPGRGSDFRVFLPAASAATVAAPRREESAPPSGSGRLVLVVDDEPELAHLICVMLERHGFRALSARDGAEALGLFRRSRTEVSALVTDVVMPGMDGPTLVAELRKIAPDLPVVAMSGNLQQPEAAQRLGDRVQGLLAKPFRAEQLLAALHEALSGGRASAAAPGA